MARTVPGLSARIESLAVTRGRIAFAVAAVIVFIVDRVSKGLVGANIAPGHEVAAIPGLVWITNAHNSGAAFGLAQRGTLIFLAASIAVAVGLVVYAVRNPAPLVVELLLGLILGGTAGNGYERLLNGTVTDFITVHWFPVFNVADSAISVGVVLLMVGYLFQRRPDA